VLATLVRCGRCDGLYCGFTLVLRGWAFFMANPLNHCPSHNMPRQTLARRSRVFVLSPLVTGVFGVMVRVLCVGSGC
jgi:hypothetical protein